MADLTTGFAGIQCPNPFWLASGPPTNSGEQVMRAFDAGWGGAVWKTIGEPIVNVSSRYSSVDWNGQRMMGLNNIELITDRPIETNLREIAEVKKRYPKHAVIASLMVESKREAWHDIVKRSEDAGADGLELNFGCPHGMSERGMGSAVGQVPEYACMITEWVKEVARTPVLVKLTPNVTDIRAVARAARRGGADGLSAINTINSITGIDLDTLTPRPDVGGLSAHGGYCGPAVKPIALHLVQQIASDPEVGLPISGIGGISGWREAAEFILLGCGTVQVCTAAMHYGYRIVEDMIDGLSNWMDEKGFRTVEDFRGLTLAKITDWKHLDLHYRIVARIHEEKCIGCELCYIACWDGAHQCIHLDGHAKPPELEAASRARIAVTPIAKLDVGQAATTPHGRVPRVDEVECVGCNLCWLVCPVPGCITMEQIDSGLAAESWEQRVAGGARPLLAAAADKTSGDRGDWLRRLLDGPRISGPNLKDVPKTQGVYVLWLNAERPVCLKVGIAGPRNGKGVRERIKYHLSSDPTNSVLARHMAADNGARGDYGYDFSDRNQRKAFLNDRCYFQVLEIPNLARQALRQFEEFLEASLRPKYCGKVRSRRED